MHPCDLDAHTLSALIHRRELSCRELMQATLARIGERNPAHNAIVMLAPEDQLLQQADAHDAMLARGQSMGFLHGLPHAVKDTANVAGWPTTWGSPLLKDDRPEHEHVAVQRIKAAGSIVIGKTNVPEFGLGSHTFNSLFGTTRNAWDGERTAGGSSGGAAVALALRLLPLADGSDFMGSLRNPAAWNHVFGMRPSMGRVPRWPRGDLWLQQLSTDGPLARTVRDLAQLLSVQAGHDSRDPQSVAQGPQSFVPDASATLRGQRIGWLGDLQGHLAIEDGILPVCEAALRQMQAAGAHVEPIALGFDLDELWHAWCVWRRALTAMGLASTLARPGAREAMDPKTLWEVDRAQGMAFAEFEQASAVRSRFYARMQQLFEQHDLLALPGVQVWPFPLSTRWPERIGSRAMDTYHRWMEVMIPATFAGLPAISVPAGFDASGRWPMGLQLIGKPLGDAALLQAAHAYELSAPALIARRPATAE